MKKIGMLFAFVLVTACGGGSKDTSTTPEPAASTVPETDETTYAAGGETGTPATDEPKSGDATAMGGGTGMPSAPDKTQPAPAEPAPPPAPMTATAELKSVKDDAPMGTITFTKRDDGKIVIEGTFSGLKKTICLHRRQLPHRTPKPAWKEPLPHAAPIPPWRRSRSATMILNR
jgi:hypothetical protein